MKSRLRAIIHQQMLLIELDTLQNHCSALMETIGT